MTLIEVYYDEFYIDIFTIEFRYIINIDIYTLSNIWYNNNIFYYKVVSK